MMAAVRGSGPGAADLAALLREHASRHSVPGAAIGILYDGVATTAYHGVADVTTGEPVTPETRFSVGSLTKSMVATVIAHLAEAGRLSLDDPLAAHLPELRGGGWAGRATLRDLLANRSGLPLSAALEFGFADHADEDDAALSRFVAELDAGVNASAFWSYTNVGWCLVGRVIETATGDSWERAMRRHLFERAAMSETTFATEPDSGPRVSGHDITRGGAVPLAPLVARAYAPAGTSLLAPVTDLLHFAARHLDEASLAMLRIPHAEVSIHGWFDAWGLGWARFDWPGAEVWGWDGLISGERSFLRLVPGHRAAIVLMTNGSTGRAMYRSLFADLLEPWLGVAFPRLRLDPVRGAAGDLSRFTGTYAWPDRTIEVAATPNGLSLRTESGEREALPLDDRTFLVDASDPDTPTVTFGSFDGSGRPGVLYSMLWGLPRVTD